MNKLLYVHVIPFKRISTESYTHPIEPSRTASILSNHSVKVLYVTLPFSYGCLKVTEN